MQITVIEEFADGVKRFRVQHQDGILIGVYPQWDFQTARAIAKEQGIACKVNPSAIKFKKVSQ